MHCKELWPWEQDMFWNTSSPRQPNRNILPILTAQVNDLTPPQITVVRASAAEPGQIAVCGPQVLSCVWIWWLFGTFLKNDSILRVCLLLTNLTNGLKMSKAWCRTYRLTLQLECARHLGSCRWMSQAGASQLYNPNPVARPRVMQELFGASALLPLARRLSVQVGCAKGSKHAKQERSSVLQFFFVLVLFLSVGTPLCLQVWTHGAATETVVSETDVNQDLEAWDLYMYSFYRKRSEDRVQVMPKCIGAV